MRAIFKRMTREDKEIHVSTGKESPMGSFHIPMWGPWFFVDDIKVYRSCSFPFCDITQRGEEEDDDP